MYSQKYINMNFHEKKTVVVGWETPTEINLFAVTEGLNSYSYRLCKSRVIYITSA